MSVFRRVLVPLDDSALADRALDAALATAAWSGAEVVLLRVQPEPASLDRAETAVDLRVIEQDVSDLLARAAAREGKVPTPPREQVRAEVRSGDVVHAVLSAVEELGCDLIVMGNHGREGLVEQITGSTTEQVLRRAPASVFVVRPEGWPYLRD